LRVGVNWADVTPPAVPEPALAGLLGVGLAMCIYRHRHGRR